MQLWTTKLMLAPACACGNWWIAQRPGSNPAAKVHGSFGRRSISFWNIGITKLFHFHDGSLLRPRLDCQGHMKG